MTQSAGPGRGADPAARGAAHDPFHELPEVLYGELLHIREARGKDHGQEESPPAGNSKDERLADLVPKLHRAKHVALCLSGGGIRSATFNLGILQGLAKLGVLRDVDYLSTVSGGGYIGSWLSCWIAEGDGDSRGFDKVIAILGQPAARARGKEPYQIRFLRDYSNYLTPRVGIFSVDTWTIVATYLRNLLLNWLVLIPLFFALLLLPRVLVHLVSGAFLAQIAHEAAVVKILLLTGGALAVFPIGYTVNNLPSIGNRRQSKLSFAFRFLMPLVLMACVLSAYWGHSYRPGCAVPGLPSFVGFGLALHLVGWVVGMICFYRKLREEKEMKKEDDGKEDAARRRKAVWSGLFCAAATGAVAGLLG